MQKVGKKRLSLASIVTYFLCFQERKLKDEIEPKYNAKFALLKGDRVVVGINFLQDLLQET